jgi:hypothetical protein
MHWQPPALCIGSRQHYALAASSTTGRPSMCDVLWSSRHSQDVCTLACSHVCLYCGSFSCCYLACVIDASLVYCWCTAGVLLVYCWCTAGVPLVYCWCTAGVPLVYCWCTAGVPLVYRWCTAGVPLVYCWCTAGVLLVYCWCTGDSLFCRGSILADHPLPTAAAVRQLCGSHGVKLFEGAAVTSVQGSAADHIVQQCPPKDASLAAISLCEENLALAEMDQCHIRGTCWLQLQKTGVPPCSVLCITH